MNDLKRVATISVCLMAAALISGCTGSAGNFSLDDLLGDLGGDLDEKTVAAGLKEALRVGTERTVDRTGKVDGFFGNQILRIVMPDELKTAASALRTVGMNEQVDQFELAMNRAAERAAGEAATVFIDAVSAMTVMDAFSILQGDETAATDYFYGKTSDELRGRFGPIVQEKMGEVGLYNSYNSLMDKYTSLPFVEKPVIDLDSYVTEKALSGLFTVLADEEKKIRHDPAARTTALLRKVFADEEIE